jgi:hypothetical protein
MNIYLVAINLHGFAFFPVGGAVEARHDAMLTGSVEGNFIFRDPKKYILNLHEIIL